MSVVPNTQNAEVGDLLEPKPLRPIWTTQQDSTQKKQQKNWILSLPCIKFLNSSI